MLHERSWYYHNTYVTYTGSRKYDSFKDNTPSLISKLAYSSFLPIDKPKTPVVSVKHCVTYSILMTTSKRLLDYFITCTTVAFILDQKFMNVCVSSTGPQVH